jgi:lysozyme family protein
MSDLRYTLVYETTTDADLPTNSGTRTINKGINLAGGAIDEFIIRYTATVATGAIDGGADSIFTANRLILNGSTFFDFRAGSADTSSTEAGSFGYLLNSLGDGRYVEVPSDTSKDATFRVPCGRNIPAGVSRLEFTWEYSQLQAAPTSGAGKIQVWARYNSNMTDTTYVGAATSYTHAANSEELVIVRLPQGVPGTLAGVYVQNDSAADQLTSVRIVSQSDYSLPLNMIRALNGDTYNGVLYALDGATTVGLTQMYITQDSPGNLFIPLLGLQLNDDLRLQVLGTAATTRTYTPIITSPVTGAARPPASQTQPVRSNVAAAVLEKSDIVTG